MLCERLLHRPAATIRSEWSTLVCILNPVYMKKLLTEFVCVFWSEHLQPLCSFSAHPLSERNICFVEYCILEGYCFLGGAFLSQFSRGTTLWWLKYFVQSLTRSICREMLSAFSHSPTCLTFLSLSSSAWTALYNVWANTEIIALTFQFTTAFCCLEAIRTWMAKRFNYVTKAKRENQCIWYIFLSSSMEQCLVFINQSLQSIMEKPR